MKRRALVAILAAATALAAFGAAAACSSDDSQPLLPLTRPQPDTGVHDAQVVEASPLDKFDGGGTQVTLTFGSCSGFTPCGGKLVGQYEFTAACVENPENAFPRVKQICQTATVSDPSGTIQGTFTFNEDAGVQRRNAIMTLNINAAIPADCANALGGCFNLGQAFDDGNGETGTCDGQDDCTCTVTRVLTPDEKWTNYATSGNNWSAGQEVNTYCAQAGTLQYQGIGLTASQHPGTFTLEAR